MKSMKPMLVAALVAGSLFACNTVVLAQPGGAPAPGAGAPPAGGPRGARAPMNADAMMTRLQTALGETNKLSDAQVPKVKAVFDDQIKKMTDLRNDQSITPADRGTKMAAIRTEASNALKAILTPAQFAIYQAMPQGGRGGRRAGGGGGGGGGAPPAAGN